MSNAGVVKGIKEGTAKITVTVYGIYGDSISATCDLTVTSNGLYYTDVPIVTNLRVSPKSDNGNSVVSVYWYIRNDSKSGTLTYTIKDLYATL